MHHGFCDGKLVEVLLFWTRRLAEDRMSGYESSARDSEVE